MEVAGEARSNATTDAMYTSTIFTIAKCIASLLENMQSFKEHASTSVALRRWTGSFQLQAES